MASVQSGKMIVGLDIGTSKVVALVGEVTADGQLEVVGIGTHPSRGLKKGVVVNIESTVQSIQRAIDEAQQMAGCRIHSAFVGIAGNHIRSLNSHGIVAIRDREVNPADIERVLDAAQAVAIPADQRVLHTLAQDYVIDNQEGVREPLGMSGVRLEAKGARGDLRGECLAEHREVRAPLRPRGRRHHPRAVGLGLFGADRGREGTGRVPGGYRRRHHRYRDLHRRRDPPYRGDPDRRRPGHQ